MIPAWASALIALSLAVSVAKSPDTPRHAFHQPVPSVASRLKGVASRAANLSPAKCRAELNRSGALGTTFQRERATNGIATPLRIIGPLGTVSFQVPPPKVMFGLLDCRQALVWIELRPLLERHQIAKIRIDSFYRNRARIRPRGKKSQHAYGLAADIISVTLKDGRELDVTTDFLGRRGTPPCGPKAKIYPQKGTTPSQVEEAIALRNFVCELGRTGAFHHILTPNFNQAHESHLHFDIKRDNRWFSLN